MGLPFVVFSRNDKVQNLLGEGDDDTTGQSQEAVAPLGGVMGLEGKTDLHDTPAQQNEAHGPDVHRDCIHNEHGL